MRVCRLWRCARVVVPEFRPHLHQSPCAICKAAESCTAPDSRSPSSHVRPNATTTTTTSPHSTGSSVNIPAPAEAALSTVERLREGLLQWLRAFPEESDAAPPLPILTSKEDFDACYGAYLRCDDTDVEEELHKTLLRTLDQQCSRSMNPVDTCTTQLSTVPAVTTRSPTSIRLPTRLTIPSMDPTAAFLTPPPSSSANVFEQHVRDVLRATPAAVVKQLAFQDALLAVRDVLDGEGIPFFLACGTALGAHRNGCFIPHDEDIDLGILFSDLCSGGSESPAAALHQAQDRIFQLANALFTSRIFLIFDVCGGVEKGFELRVLHTPTNTRIDVNLYYPPIPGSDDALVQAGGPFLWASSFYEAAGSRTHQMYRYRHQPFDGELVRRPFCERRCDAPGFLTPPVRYLEENYGPNWKTPKKYSYTEGLAKEFKNIIEE